MWVFRFVGAVGRGMMRLRCLWLIEGYSDEFTEYGIMMFEWIML